MRFILGLLIGIAIGAAIGIRAPQSRSAAREAFQQRVRDITGEHDGGDAVSA